MKAEGVVGLMVAKVETSKKPRQKIYLKNITCNTRFQNLRAATCQKEIHGLAHNPQMEVLFSVKAKRHISEQRYETLKNPKQLHEQQ